MHLPALEPMSIASQNLNFARCPDRFDVVCSRLNLLVIVQLLPSSHVKKIVCVAKEVILILRDYLALCLNLRDRKTEPRCRSTRWQRAEKRRKTTSRTRRCRRHVRRTLCPSRSWLQKTNQFPATCWCCGCTGAGTSGRRRRRWCRSGRGSDIWSGCTAKRWVKFMINLRKNWCRSRGSDRGTPSSGSGTTAGACRGRNRWSRIGRRSF